MNVCVCVRVCPCGAEMTKVRDVITDANLTPSSFNPERVRGGGVFDFGGDGGDGDGDGDGGEGKGTSSSIAGAEGGEEAMVHGGFLSAYDSVRARVFAAVDDIIAHTPCGSGSLDEEGNFASGAGGDDTWHVFVTGREGRGWKGRGGKGMGVTPTPTRLTLFHPAFPSSLTTTLPCNFSRS